MATNYTAHDANGAPAAHDDHHHEHRQSFFQRRAGLSTVTACVGAGSGGYAAVDMAAEEVAAFTEAGSGRWARAFRADGSA